VPIDHEFVKFLLNRLCYAGEEAAMDFRTLHLQIDGPIARLTLTRPDEANRIDDRALRELTDACEAISASDAARVALLSAEGADFCAGWSDNVQPGLDPFGPIAGLPTPVIAAVQGAVLSGGLELALACDVRIASEDARFGLPEVSEGSLPRGGGSQRLPRIAGRAIAASMLLLGDELDAQGAYRAGLVSRVVPAKRLTPEAEALATRIAAHGPLALHYAKEAVQHGGELSLDQALRYELDLSVILQTTQDRAEGVQAFIEKRPPKFRGQ
jgi:enoyl-CoA hydratase